MGEHGANLGSAASSFMVIMLGLERVTSTAEHTLLYMDMQHQYRLFNSNVSDTVV